MRRYTVAALASELDFLVGRHYPVLLVEGELAQVSLPASGHAYLVLRDRQAALNAVVWRSDWARLQPKPKQGDRVVCRGRLGLYKTQSRYQLYATDVQPAGEGRLAKRIAEIKARLDRDGLLDPRRKRPLPRFPKIVGLATSPTGAALQDFLRVSRGRFPGCRVLLAPCTVQGPEAPSSVLRALELLIEDGRSEVLVVTRGGGGKEDLLPFMDEGLARAIAHSPIPTVSAVGHEIDTTIADLVADAVAPTPSAAALLVLPDGPALAQRVDEAALALERAALRCVRRGRERVEGLRARLRHPGAHVAAGRTRHTELVARLHGAIAGHLDRARTRLQVAERLVPAVERDLVRRRLELQRHDQHLRAMSPYAVLERGYAIVTAEAGVVTSPAEVAPGAAIGVRVAGGTFGATVDPG